ncbi:hypothetical protein [Kitasatospora sp. CB01950]|uniref:hypothetical protein n=1 Tax=Kitasatospora sp. CB01950 TaxID=1703930 RepID=UPI00093BF6DC|nr:hypothetical protein [Kitasatospora sp. CB01950]OKJ16096.1 hypothetical protein AMK19_08010 [Kitasatospora sp. CB01950]
MTTATLVAPWEISEFGADMRTPHPAGEIVPALRGTELPRMRRALVLSGWVAPELGTFDISTNDTTAPSTLTSLSFTED